MLAFYWLVILNILWFNNGGHGFDLPYNLVCWMAAALMALPVTLTVRRIHISATGMWLLAGAVLMTLPAAWAPNPDGLRAALPRLTGMWCGVLFYVVLLQVRFDRRFIIGLLGILAAAAMVESAVTLICIWYPQYLPETLQQFATEYSPQGFGIFEQRNVNASFIATGYTGLLALVAFWQVNRVWQCLLGAGVIFVAATLVLIESRIGWIGLVTGTVAICLLANASAWRSQSTPQQRWLAALLPLAGIALGDILLSQSVLGVLDEHDGSNHQRLLTLEYTLKMIAMHPFKGWGLGMYMGEFQRYMASLPVNPSKEIMGHPHNEVLYQWFEGGIAALLGGVCCVMGWLALARKRRSVWRVVALVMTLPILLHTQVEYPLYFSVPHFLAILLLMRAADCGRPTRLCAVNVTCGALAGVALYGLVLAGQCFYTGQILLKFEAYQLEDMEQIAELKVPWLMEQRWGHDMTMLRLVRFKQSKDAQELKAFVKEGERWMILNPGDEGMVSSLRVVKSYLRDG
jgi:O-antigen polymerase